MDIHEVSDYRRMSKIMGISTNNYKKTYEKYKNAAKEYNIDLFFCDVLMNAACIDIAHNLRKPVVSLTSLLHCNYKLSIFFSFF
jgi:hypothetical protein